MIEYVGPVSSNNRVINRQNLSEQTFGGMKKLPIKCKANSASTIFILKEF